MDVVVDWCVSCLFLELAKTRWQTSTKWTRRRMSFELEELQEYTSDVKHWCFKRFETLYFILANKGES